MEMGLPHPKSQSNNLKISITLALKHSNKYFETNLIKRLDEMSTIATKLKDAS